MGSTLSPRSSLVGKRSTLSLSFALLGIIALLVAACSNSSGGTKSGPKVLTAICSVGGSYTQNMSPFSPNVNCGVDGIVYENLEYVNGVTGQETPMLATGHTFSSDNKTLTFTTRQSVKWSDGQAFSAKDVEFTFNMLKQYPDADTNALWQSLDSVSATDANTVAMTFKAAVPTLLPFIEGIYIVPQHIWSSVGDPAKFTNTTPVGTGPMKLKSFSAQQISYVKNPDYWQADKVKVDELDYPVVNSNDTALLKMASHQADWTGIFSAALKTSFVDKDPTHNHVYMVPVVPVQIVPNLKNPLLSQLVVRQAISAALDRQQMSVSGEAGLEQPASPTALMPGQEKYLDSSFGGKLPEFGAADPAKATQLLDGAGFKKGSDGIYADASGHKLSFKATVPGDFSDYVQDLQIAQQNLKAAGIDLQLNKVSDDDWRADRASHNFDLIMTGGFFGPTPYYYMEPLLHSTHINGASATNWAGWNDAKTDQLLEQYASTSDTNTQVQAIQGLSSIMAQQLPVIPVLDAIQFFEYSTANWTGWPTPDNPYAVGSAYQLAAGDNEQVLLHLTPAS
ncbi:MAG TPA: ABC transporter substrate-binding protein [Ktedonobacterales bacterium]|jgi:peptide/nickel transport system substrate-binding protein|nr:ABC transporter substrate-binding protein [Ktedonobacterales bacterium]